MEARVAPGLDMCIGICNDRYTYIPIYLYTHIYIYIYIVFSCKGPGAESREPQHVVAVSTANIYTYTPIT